MNYLTNRELAYSFNGKGECFLYIDKSKNETIKIENCYKHESQENLFYKIDQSKRADIFYIQNGELKIFKQNVDVYKTEGNYLLVKEDERSFYYIYENGEIKNILKTERNFFNLRNILKDEFFKRNKKELTKKFIDFCKKKNISLVLKKDNILQNIKINKDITSLINQDYYINNLILTKDRKKYSLFLDDKSYYNYVVKRAFGTGSASNIDSTRRIEEINEVLDNDFIDKYGYKARELTTLRNLCIENITDNERFLWCDIVNEILEIEARRNKKNYFYFYYVAGTETHQRIKNALSREQLLSIEDLVREFFWNDVDYDSIITKSYK